MTEQTATTVRAKTKRAFKDASDEREYGAGEVIENMPEGLFINFKAAGLVEAAPAETAQAADQTTDTAAAKSKR